MSSDARPSSGARRARGTRAASATDAAKASSKPSRASAGKAPAKSASASARTSARKPSPRRASARSGGKSPAGKQSEAGRPWRRAPSEVSAGGVVVRGDELVVIVPTRRAPDGSRVLGLPKGHIDPGETPEQAARREVLEEAGVRGRSLGLLGEIRYRYRLGARLICKEVSFYLFRYVGGDPADHDHEVEEARWMSLAEAEKALTHVGEREMVALARARLRENGAQDR